MNPQRILIAGIGNIFLGDDAFGVETVRRLMEQEVPDSVKVVDFGIRSYDLAFAFGDGYDTVILVDSTSRGQSPGTLYLIEPDPGAGAATAVVNGHSMNPVAALQLAAALNGNIGKVYLVGCEPAVLEPSEDRTGLSAAVGAAVPGAVEMILSLVSDLLGTQTRETVLKGDAT